MSTRTPLPVGPAVSIALSLLVLLTAGRAQQAVAAQTWGVVPIHTAADDLGVSYGIWGAGEGYKASFHDGMTFVPYLGREYPHNQPWSWRTTSVRVGEHELVTKEPGLAFEGSHAEFDLGGVIEAYDLLPEGLEQTFVVHDRPGAGDLVVRGRVASALHCASRGAGHAPLAFFDGEGRRIVGYGAAVAIDANGARRAMSTTCEQDEITLRLDGDWLATAALPVVVDPLIYNAVSGSSTIVSDSDLVVETESPLYRVWFTQTAYASGADRDLFFRRRPAGITAVNFTIYSDITASWTTQNGSCAYNADADHAVAVFDRAMPTIGNLTRVIRYHRHHRNDTNFNTTVGDVTTTGNSCYPAVGGSQSDSAGAGVLVVWQQEMIWSTIQGAVVDLATDTVGPVFPIATGGTIDCERPGVARHADGGPENEWLVTYQQKGALLGPSLWHVYVRQVDALGQVQGSRRIDAASGQNRITPSIDGGGGRYLVAFATYPAGTPAAGLLGHEIRAARLDWDFTSHVGAEPHGAEVLRSQAAMTYFVGGVTFDSESASHWGLQWCDNTNELLRFSTLGYRGHEIGEHEIWSPSGMLGNFVFPGDGCFDPSTREFHLIDSWSTGAGIANGSLIHRFQYSPVQPWSTAGTACSPASISWVGDQHVGSELGAVSVFGAAFDSIHLVAVATAPSPPVSLDGLGLFVPGCFLLIPPNGPDYLGVLGLGVGSNLLLPLALPEFLPADTYYMQDFHTVGGGSFDFVATQRLTLPTVRD